MRRIWAALLAEREQRNDKYTVEVQGVSGWAEADCNDDANYAGGYATEALAQDQLDAYQQNYPDAIYRIAKVAER